jgi:hypothetical protein
MESSAAFKIITWNQTYKMLLKQSKTISTSFKPEILVGLARGGWIPTRIMSDLLDNPAVASVRMEYYEGQNQTKPHALLTQPVSVNVKKKSVLLLDEVSDTGESLNLAKGHILCQGAAEIKTATLFCKPWSKFEPDFYEKQTGLWIVFPWELKETVICIVRNSKKDTEKTKQETLKLIKAGAPKDLVLRFVKEALEENK